MSGKIVGPIYLCLKEVNGRMSENFKSNLPRVENVVVACSASGKLTTSLVEYWRDNCLIPSLSSQKTLLLSDSWPGQAGGKGIYESVKGLKRLEIPWKTTSKIQPLDVCFNPLSPIRTYMSHLTKIFHSQKFSRMVEVFRIWIRYSQQMFAVRNIYMRLHRYPCA